MGAFILSRAENREPYVASLLLFILYFAVAIGYPMYANYSRPFKQSVKPVHFIEGKALILNGDEIIEISKITGMSYQPGDSVMYNEYPPSYMGIYFCESWRERVREFQTVKVFKIDYFKVDKIAEL